MKNCKKSSLVFSMTLIFLWGTFVFLLNARQALAVTPWGPMSEIEKAARKEGKLVIYAAGGHAGTEAKRAISKRFKEKYGISIDWTSLSARDIAPRVLAEQRTKQYTVDVTMSGIAGNYTTLKPKGYYIPMYAPSTLEKGVWRLNPATAFPKARDWHFVFMSISPSFFINTSLLPREKAPKSYKETAYKAYLRGFGPSGVFEQDDMIVWSGPTRTAKGPVGRTLLQNISMGMTNTEIDKSFPGPGKVFVNKSRFLESNLRSFYRNWLQNLVGGA